MVKATPSMQLILLHPYHDSIRCGKLVYSEVSRLVGFLGVGVDLADEVPSGGAASWCGLPRAPSARVNIAQRVVHAVGVAVEALGTRRVLDETVGGEEGNGERVVHLPVHVDQPETGKVLVAGEAAVEGVRHVVVTETGGVAPPSPGVMAQPLHGVAVDDRREAPLMVL